MATTVPIFTMLNMICVGVLVHMKCQMKSIPVSVTAVVMSYHCHGNRNFKFVCCGVFMSGCIPYSLIDNQLTDTGAIALARALQHNKSLEELK